MSLTFSFDLSFIRKQAFSNPALFLILQRINGVERFVKIDGYDHHSYAEIKLLMENKIASLDPTARPLPWALFFGWDSELIPDLPLLSKDVLNDFQLKFLFVWLDRAVTWPGWIKRLLRWVFINVFQVLSLKKWSHLLLNNVFTGN